MASDIFRCFGSGDPLYERYHDAEWGARLTAERDVFERLSLEAFQSGLAWITILRKRDGFRAAFDNFEPERVAAVAPISVRPGQGEGWPFGLDVFGMASVLTAGAPAKEAAIGDGTV